MPRRRGFAKKISYTHWTYGSWFSLQGAGTGAINVLPAQHEPETLLRIRGTNLAYIDAASVPGKLVSVGVGLIAVPEGTGTTVLWSPITDGDAPWIWADYFEIGYEEMVTDVVDVPGLTSYRSVIDNKAMRILRNQEVQFVLENATILTASNVNVSGSARFLSGT